MGVEVDELRPSMQIKYQRQSTSAQLKQQQPQQLHDSENTLYISSIQLMQESTRPQLGANIDCVEQCGSQPLFTGGHFHLVEGHEGPQRKNLL